MKHLKTTILALLLFLSSCTQEYIPDGKMPEILAEIYIVDRYIIADYTLALKADTSRIYESVISEHGYSTGQFIKTFERHLTRPSKLKQLYEKALDLVIEEQELVKRMIESKQRKDIFANSLRKVSSDTNRLIFPDCRNRAIRWLSRPYTNPSWKFTYNDSLNNLFQTPAGIGWWSSNLRKDIPRYYYIMKDYEKNSRTIPLSRKFSRTLEKRVAGAR
ncbi:MAG: DUF4296 domain-containing protein [Bacteroidales bacterium]|jgi:hypothetical protein